MQCNTFQYFTNRISFLQYPSTGEFSQLTFDRQFCLIGRLVIVSIAFSRKRNEIKATLH